MPCASGWCGKVIEGETGAFREDGNKKIELIERQIHQRLNF